MNIFISEQFSSDFQETPITLVDIGASGGVQEIWKKMRPHLQVIGFEPDQREFNGLVSRAPEWIRYFNTALSDTPGSITFHLTREQKTSSVFEPNIDLLSRYPDVQQFDVLKTVEIQAETLDNVLAANSVTHPDFIKIDTQGAELGILQGSASTLESSVVGLEVEVEFIPIYKGQPLFSEVEQFVREKGFELFDLRPFYWKRECGRNLGGSYGQIAFADALFFKSPQAMYKLLSLLPDDAARRRKTLRTISIVLLFGYVDYAVELFDSQRELFSQDQRLSFEAETEKTKRAANNIPDFRGRWRIANALSRMSETLDPTNMGWSVGRNRLGNAD